jgi:methyl-accepting chemotaxis protein
MHVNLKSLKMRLILPLVIIITILLIGLGIYDSISTSKKLNADLENTAEIISGKIASSSVLPLWDMNKESIEGIVASEMEDKQVYSIMVTEGTQNVLFVGKERDENGYAVDSDGRIIGEYLIKKKDIMKGDKKIGEVAVYLTPEYMKKELVTSIISIIVRALLINIAIVVILFVIINMFLVKPINSIITRIKDIAEHEDLTKDVEVSDTEEFGLLATAFNEMIHKLKNSKQQLQDYGAELERKIAVRTMEMTKKIQELENKKK